MPPVATNGGSGRMAAIFQGRVMGFWQTMTDMVRGLVRDMSDDYRPERHYMGGPGPRWHARHAG